MTSLDDVQEAAYDAIHHLTKQAAKATNSGSTSQRYADAARAIAEALAWVERPDQPHGGTTTLSTG